MSCLNCKERDDEVIKKAQKFANEKGQWVGIFTTATGEKDFAAINSGQYPWEQFLSPELLHDEVRNVLSDTSGGDTKA